ncbi:MAG: Bug family tripartite tricarboxylate transporter substrate binding protein [Actinomycetota bacterium]
MSAHRFRRAAVIALAPLLFFTASACGNEDEVAEESAAWPAKSLEIIVPAKTGGGWDLTGRTIQEVVEQSRLTDRGVQVRNIDGGTGTIGLAEMAKKNDSDTLMVMGLVMLGGIAVNEENVSVTLDDVTPIARLTGEYEVLAVAKDSPYKTLDDFIKAFKADPKKLPIGGGPTGDTDQITVALLAKELGIDVADINYTGYSGGGEIIGPLRSGEVKAAVSGVSEFAEAIESGQMRALAVSSAKRLSVIDAPTFIEEGIDLEFANWRGVVAAKSVTAEEKKEITAFVDRVHGSEGWRRALIVNGWEDRYLTGDEFASYVTSEQKRITEVLTDLGIAK